MIWKQRLLFTVAILGALTEFSAQGAIVRISKSYPDWDTANNGVANLVNAALANDDPALYEFKVSSPVFFMDAMRWNRDGVHVSHRMVDSAAWHEVIFEDSATYNMLEDLARKHGVATSAIDGTQYNMGPVQGDFWHDGESVRKVRFLAGNAAGSAKHTPVIDMRSVPRGAWGTYCWFGNWNETCQVEIIGLKFVFDPGAAGSWADAVVFPGGTGSKAQVGAPVYKDCIFDGLRRLTAYNGNKHVDPGQPEVQHCAFRLGGDTDNFAYEITNMNPDTFYNGYEIDVENSTFVVAGDPASSKWSFGRGNKGEFYNFSYCLFYNMAGAVRDSDAKSWANCLEYNASNASGTPANSFLYHHITGTTSLVANPMLLDPVAGAFYLLGSGSPAINGGAGNIGFDQLTVPVELSSFSQE